MYINCPFPTRASLCGNLSMSGVRGPNSALTEFLRSQGINANEIRRRHERRQEQEEAAEEQEQQVEAAADEAVGDQPAQDDEVARIARAAARKRRGDDMDAAQRANEGTAICPQCNSRFTLTVYSRPVDPENEANGYLCRNCSVKTSKEAKKRAPRGANKGAANKKRKKMAAELLDLRFLVPPSLQDLCINLVAEYIDSVDELGGLTVSSFNKISRILSKNRRLSSKTMQLFLRHDVTTLEFWDCSSLAPEAYNLIPALCPNLERLVLGMCGQLEGECLVRIAQLPNLKSVQLDGPFMIRKDAWMDFFDICGSRLQALRVSGVYRIDAEVLALLAEGCTNLEVLELERLCQMYDPTPLHLLGANMPHLKRLVLGGLEPEAWSDDAMIQILNMVGAQLDSLVLKYPGTNLSDQTIDAIAATCGNLHALEIPGFMSISEEAVIDMFTKWRRENSNTGVQKLNLEKCFNIGEAGVSAAIEHSGATLVELNINSLRKIGPGVLNKLCDLPNLTKLDIGFVGRCDPAQIYKLSTSNTLKQVLAFGNIRLSGMPLPTGVTVVGTM